MPTKIEWAEESWNPITGCTKISPGCKNCYAERMSKRLAGRFGYPKDDPFAVTFHEDKLEQPLRWRKPRTIFVCSMGDLFHDSVTQYQIEEVFFITARCPQHTFLVLTKRPERMRQYIEYLPSMLRWAELPDGLSNVWLGVTAENQEQWYKRVDILQQIPAAKRFVSVEPMLSAIQVPNRPQFSWFYNRSIHWVICGAETGPGKRLMNLDWARSLRDQCQVAGVPFFFKKDSNGNRELDGRLWEEWTE